MSLRVGTEAVTGRPRQSLKSMQVKNGNLPHGSHRLSAAGPGCYGPTNYAQAPDGVWYVLAFGRWVRVSLSDAMSKPRSPCVFYRIESTKYRLTHKNRTPNSLNFNR